jgi:hypothetical protein
LHRLVVDRRSPSVSSETWQRVVDREEFDSFLLADATGTAMLHAPFEMKLDPYDARGQDLPPAFFEVLEREGVALRSPFGSLHNFRYVETIVLPGDEITAVGRATIEIRSGRPVALAPRAARQVSHEGARGGGHHRPTPKT